MKQVNQRDAEYYVANEQDFMASALSGHAGRSYSAGRLNDDEAQKYRDAEADMRYVVTSYSTPIAWRTSTGWYVVEQKFSVTTSKHQGIVRRAVASTLVGA